MVVGGVGGVVGGVGGVVGDAELTTPSMEPGE